MNIIPIIAKADTISKSELHKFKIKIMSELVSNGVQIYQFPTDDEAVTEINASMNVSRDLLFIQLYSFVRAVGRAGGREGGRAFYNVYSC